MPEHIEFRWILGRNPDKKTHRPALDGAPTSTKRKIERVCTCDTECCVDNFSEVGLISYRSEPQCGADPTTVVLGTWLHSQSTIFTHVFLRLS